MPFSLIYISQIKKSSERSHLNSFILKIAESHVLVKEHKMWRKLLRLGLLASAALNPPAFLFAQNPARGIKFERIGMERGSRKTAFMAPSKIPLNETSSGLTCIRD
jgi:hypothetical protein